VEKRRSRKNPATFRGNNCPKTAGVRVYPGTESALISLDQRFPIGSVGDEKSEEAGWR